MSRSVGASVAVCISCLRARPGGLLICMAVGLACAAPPADARGGRPGLVAAYAFDEGSGVTSVDASGNGHGAALTRVRWTSAGRYGGAIVLNGRKSVIRIAQPRKFRRARGMTMEAWVRPRGRAGIRSAMTKRGRLRYRLELRRGRLAAFARAGRPSRRGNDRGTGRARRWRFLATTFDGRVVRTYLDGKQIARRRARGAVAPSLGAFDLGARSRRRGFRGAIDNVRIYRGALSRKELRVDRGVDVASAPRPGSNRKPRQPKPPAPAPAPNPSPPAPSASRNCMPDPSLCGFPDVETVGVAPGAALAPVNGAVTLSTPGQVYENKLVTGSISVTAPNVTIRNVKLVTTDPSYGISTFGWRNNTAGLVIENVEIDLNGRLATKGIAFDNYTARRVFFHNGSDCAHFGKNVVIEDSLCVAGPDANSDGWPDSTGFCSGPEHFDGFQSDGGDTITLRHNTIRVPCRQTSAILMSTNTAPIRNVTIADNLMAGGGYTLYCNAGPDVPNETVTGNRFARSWFPRSGYWGASTGCQAADVYAGNVWDDTGAPAG